MNLRNVDGFPEMLESEVAQFYSCILQVNGGKRQRGYIKNARQRGRITRRRVRFWGTRGSIIAGLKSVDYRRLGRRESGLTLGSLLVAFVITFTVAGSVALGITLAYTAVLGLLHAFAPSSRKPQPALVLVHSQGQASGN